MEGILYYGGTEAIEPLNLGLISLLLFIIVIAAFAGIVFLGFKGNLAKSSAVVLLGSMLAGIVALLYVNHEEDKDVASQTSDVLDALEVQYQVKFLDRDAIKLPLDEEDRERVLVAPSGSGYGYYDMYGYPTMQSVQFDKCYITLNSGQYAVECLQPINTGYYYPMLYNDMNKPNMGYEYETDGLSSLLEGLQSQSGSGYDISGLSSLLEGLQGSSDGDYDLEGLAGLLEGLDSYYDSTGSVSTVSPESWQGQTGSSSSDMGEYDGYTTDETMTIYPEASEEASAESSGELIIPSR